MGRFIENNDAQEGMICISAGAFLYGERKEKRELPEFWIARAPVTNAEYAQFVIATEYEPPNHWEAGIPPDEILDHPVTQVSCYEAVAYAEWVGKRLPTEEEWEKAARGIEGWAYPWGEWEEGRCNMKEVGVGTTTPVGQYSPEGDSPYGCVDMAGNVFEWTASMDGKYQILRGGAYNHGQDLAHSTFRIRHKPSYRYRNIGFRLGSTMGGAK
ncbi:MAG TPA: formylglycine-generating enzyme family protein [Anaerolineae bacterium]|nr:formylglycine-generating enzyme family protein [Anaerolineae bacterium]